MAFPVEDVIKPSALSGQLNGRIDPSKMIGTPGQAGGATVTLVAPAHRAWRALAAAALQAGHTLKIGWPNSSYRNYEDQKRIFLERYRTAYKANTDVKWWNGQKWYKWYGATAAAPGTSNHGWGLAIDVGEERDGDGGTESVDTGTVNWLVANERRFGFSHELQSEPWHIRYYAGDNLPQAVLDYERSGGTAPQQEDDMQALLVKGDHPDAHPWWITDGIAKRYCATSEHAAQLAFAGLLRWNNGGPFVVPQSFVDLIPTVPSDGWPGYGGVITIVREQVLDIVRKDGITGAADANHSTVDDSVINTLTPVLKGEAQRTIDSLGWTLGQVKERVDSLVVDIAESLPSSSTGGLTATQIEGAVRTVIIEQLGPIFDLPGE